MSGCAVAVSRAISAGHVDGDRNDQRVVFDGNGLYMFRSDSKAGFVILEDVTIGICDGCGSRFYTADTPQRGQDVATGAVAAQRFDEILVAHAR